MAKCDLQHAPCVGTSHTDMDASECLDARQARAMRNTCRTTPSSHDTPVALRICAHIVHMSS
eukprot:10138060-Prorocentrum_lima.AAC.1